MDKNLFEKSVDQTRLDRLRGEIIASVSEFEDEGYNNLEIARALVWVAYRRAFREKLWVQDSFFQHVRDMAGSIMKAGKEAGDEEIHKMLAKEIN